MISSSGTSSKPCSVSMPFRYLMGLPLGSWIMRKVIVPSVEVAGYILTGTRTRERRRLPDQTGMGAMGYSGRYKPLSESGSPDGSRKRNKQCLCTLKPDRRNVLKTKTTKSPWALVSSCNCVPPFGLVKVTVRGNLDL